MATVGALGAPDTEIVAVRPRDWPRALGAVQMSYGRVTRGLGPFNFRTMRHTGAIRTEHVYDMMTNQSSGLPSSLDHSTFLRPTIATVVWHVMSRTYGYRAIFGDGLLRVQVPDSGSPSFVSKLFRDEGIRFAPACRFGAAARTRFNCCCESFCHLLFGETNALDS